MLGLVKPLFSGLGGCTAEVRGDFCAEFHFALQCLNLLG